MSSRISAHDALHHATFKPLGDDVYKLKPGLDLYFISRFFEVA